MAPPPQRPTSVALLAATLAATVVAASGGSLPPNGKINGLNFLNGQWSSQAKYDSPQALRSLDSLRNQTGASWIAMTFCWCKYTGTPHRNSMPSYISERLLVVADQKSVDDPGPIAALAGTSPSDAALLQMTAAAHARNISVLWRPCVDPKPMGST